MAKPAGKKPKGGKAKKQRATEHKKRIKAATGAAAGGGGGDDGGKDLGLAPAGAKGGHQRNPKAFVFSGRGKAKRQAARSAEKDQRRMHGAAALAPLPLTFPLSCPWASISASDIARGMPRRQLAYKGHQYADLRDHRFLCCSTRGTRMLKRHHADGE